MSQKKPVTCTKNNRVIPGAVNRKSPIITAAIPSSRTSHQGIDMFSVVADESIDYALPLEPALVTLATFV
jgi:hypothetical protein